MAAPATVSRSTQAAGSGLGNVDDESQIRSVLSLYESAYNRLDARAASTGWPGVNSGALNRAFQGLVSQRISLGTCDITKIGAMAGDVSAERRGAESWRGIQTAQRYWAFDLLRSRRVGASCRFA
jgi:hypothetical protein